MSKVFIPSMSEDFWKTPQISITRYARSGGGYSPSVKVFLARGERRICVGFDTRETPAATRYKEDGMPVYKDSAVEMFLKPFDGDARYLNLEFNSSCAAVFGFGDGKNDREELVRKYKKSLNASAAVSRKNWKIYFEIPFEIIGEIYGKKFCPFTETVKANFFKCGDETPFPHYGSAFPIPLDYPEFHRPQYFGEMIFLKT
ncbi:MAG: hypothetical protein LBP79_06250 [Clostridiales bacterium]|jgi:hypothetical protein|nr:hypothetical protein [Clostridiales bacterium]